MGKMKKHSEIIRCQADPISLRQSCCFPRTEKPALSPYLRLNPPRMGLAYTVDLSVASITP